MGGELRVEALSVAYGPVRALSGIDLEVAPGEAVALVGANGAGKTTLLRTVAGVQRAAAGRVVLDGRDVRDVPAHVRARMGLVLVPEGRRIFPRLTVEENLRLGGWASDDAEGRMRRVYELFPVLRERRRQLAITLSGGEQQMLALGRALMRDPRVLLLDEPSMGLAPIVTANVFQLLREINAAGVSLLLVEQNARMALRIADRGYVLELGRVVLEGRAEDLLSSEQVRRAYLGEV